jgi:hypothetical protein
VTISNGIGRLVESETDTCAWPITQSSIITDEWFSYDKDGRMTDMWESTPHSSGYYHTTVTYNPDGSVASISGIPGYTAYTFGVDGEGRPFNTSQGSTWIIGRSSTTGVSYDAASRPLTVPIGTNSADKDTFTYDSLEHMKTYTFAINGKAMSGTLSWNPNGSLGSLAITDTFNSGGAQTCNSTYDDVARLTNFNCGSSVWNQTFGYDQYDNLTKTGNPGTSWNPGYNSANNQMIGSSYDANGNLTYDGVSTYSWNVFGKFLGTRVGSTSPSCGSSGSLCTTYDAMGRIVETSNGATYRWYLYSPIGRLAQMFVSGTVAEARILLPGGLTARPQGSTGSTIYVDHKN